MGRNSGSSVKGVRRFAMQYCSMKIIQYEKQSGSYSVIPVSVGYTLAGITHAYVLRVFLPSHSYCRYISFSLSLQIENPWFSRHEVMSQFNKQNPTVIPKIALNIQKKKQPSWLLHSKSAIQGNT